MFHPHRKTLNMACLQGKANQTTINKTPLHAHQATYYKNKTQKTSANEGMEKSDLLHIPDGACMKNQFGSFSNKIEF